MFSEKSKLRPQEDVQLLVLLLCRQPPHSASLVIFELRPFLGIFAGVVPVLISHTKSKGRLSFQKLPKAILLFLSRNKWFVCLSFRCHQICQASHEMKDSRCHLASQCQEFINNTALHAQHLVHKVVFQKQKQNPNQLLTKTRKIN